MLLRKLVQFLIHLRSEFANNTFLCFTPQSAIFQSCQADVDVGNKYIFIIELSKKRAKIKNRCNQVPHLAQDTNWKVKKPHN